MPLNWCGEQEVMDSLYHTAAGVLAGVAIMWGMAVIPTEAQV